MKIEGYLSENDQDVDLTISLILQIMDLSICEEISKKQGNLTFFSFKLATCMVF